ncbi:RsmB/NOP family class I SAM-dependent RNA methyltransferase [archaeon]|nr:MAG: RsmB/NOP family class I SAM-dependent RNA methyltransferase [archaeon]
MPSPLCLAPSGQLHLGKTIVLTPPSPPFSRAFSTLCVQGEKVLDMASAPGGKTTYLAQLMENRGVLVANLARMGVVNTTVVCMDGRKIPDAMRGFDRILLDAPCTGLGIISRDPSVRTQKTRDDIVKMSHLQKQLILAACDALDAESSTGGIMVYSTCSVTVEENEQVVNYLLRKRHVKLLPIFEEGEEDVGRPVRARACVCESMCARELEAVFSHLYLMHGCAE